ncbi:MAG TPA: twin-arginine translocase TatA/TatE family subunit [Cytophagales bacterium]|nr:twin-arginine translocase TatA/TatE family subunit [Cytophagales bacterium]
MVTLNMFLFAGIGGWEVFLILAAFLLLFGAKKIPELARGLGKGLREFKDVTSGIKNDLEKENEEINRAAEVKKDQ